MQIKHRLHLDIERRQELLSLLCSLYNVLYSILEDPDPFHKILGRNIQCWDEPYRLIHRCHKQEEALLKAAFIHPRGRIQGSLVLGCWVET